MLQALFVSQVRVKILQHFFSHPQKMFYIRQMTRLVDEQVNAVRRELNNLADISLLQSEKRGNRLYYHLDQNHSLFQDLLALFVKTTYLGKDLVDNQGRLGKVKWIFFDQSFAQHEETEEDQVDVFVVGEVILPELSSLIAKEEQRRDQEINYSVMDEKEFSFRLEGKDPFLTAVLTRPRITVLGNGTDLLV